MALWVCNRCTTKFAVGASYCPQCTSTDHREDGEDVAKITKAGGASYTAAEADPLAATEEPPVELPAQEPAPSASPAVPEAEAEQVASATGLSGRPARSRTRNNGYKGGR